MALYAISDLHLALNGDKPMDIFGDCWFKHDVNIKKNWLDVIKEEDTVLIAGDISWSINMEAGRADLDWIHELPGQKILIRGNHDYWWNSITKLNKLYSDMHFIQNNYFTYEDYAICGTRGWISPFSDAFTEKDEKIYNRELIRLRLSLESAKAGGFEKFIVMIHYPPTNDKFQDSGFIDIIREFKVEKVIYGHLHGNFQSRIADNSFDGIEYLLTSCDFLNFYPLLIQPDKKK